jgi:hypothetical protein
MLMLASNHGPGKWPQNPYLSGFKPHNSRRSDLYVDDSYSFVEVSHLAERNAQTGGRSKVA